MKRTIIAICLFTLLAFAGCSAKPEIGALSVRNRATGEVISLGVTRGEAEAVTGLDAASIMTDTLYDVERVSYHDSPGIELGYKDGKVISIHLTQFGPDWEIAGGVHPNMEQAEAERQYADNSLRAKGEKGGILLGYDENQEAVVCDADRPYDTPYTLRISYAPFMNADGDEIADRIAVGIIAIQDTSPYR